jgi:hypothetical protein
MAPPGEAFDHRSMAVMGSGSEPAEVELGSRKSPIEARLEHARGNRGDLAPAM